MGCGLSKAHSNPEVLVFHGSARLTVHGRRLIVQRHQAGWKQAHIAAAMGVSRKCVKTWIERYDLEGEAGLVTRSSRPHRIPNRTSEPTEQKVLAARVEHREGPDVLGPRVYVAGGHGMWGITHGPVTGRLLAQMMVTGKQPEHIRPFDPLRRH